MKEPTRKEDAKNLSLIGGAALAGLLVTLGFIAGQAASVKYRVVVPEVEVIPDPAPAPVVVTEVVEPPPPPPPVEPPPVMVTGNHRLYGTVVTRRGAEYTGYIRWDRNEGSWADQLDAAKVGRRGRVSRTSGIRFGHVDRIEVLSSDRALFTLRSGEEVELGARATDLGSGLRALEVHGPNGRLAEFDWSDLDMIDFQPAPEDVLPAEARMYGTLTTRSGLDFTGYITWDVDEIYSTDVLDGEDRGYDREIPFGDIERIERNSHSSARVTLLDGEEMVLRGTNDVDDSNRGITVSDPGLGQIEVQWDDFDQVRFHGADSHARLETFDGGQPIRGTVVTESGEEISGNIRWDNDEAFSWEMLDGEYRDVEFSVEFGNIARIVRTNWGAEVTLKDGRSFELSDSNDVDDDNGGISVYGEGLDWEVDWDDFVELRLEG